MQNTYENVTNTENLFIDLIKKSMPFCNDDLVCMMLGHSRSMYNKDRTRVSKEEMDALLGYDVPENMVQPIFEAGKKSIQTIYEFRDAVQNAIKEDRGSNFRARKTLLDMLKMSSRSGRERVAKVNQFVGWNIGTKIDPENPNKFMVKYSDELTFGYLAEECQKYFGYKKENTIFSIGSEIYTYQDTKNLVLSDHRIKSGSGS